ncbi:hypothetical protein LNL84_02355 [Vibrio sp. ZSDZ34]|uniref:Uncharacterized protein n=1 Tax=Vibrio gelatinilyticus TaxID=2893468 RepID=A0A9X1W8Y8_9VIBR|nr:hypothetical protein [Vibrio gelatinilyticus]MCJ2375666.1 hypothetical protein [Vibrio gelatinilyticus]
MSFVEHQEKYPSRARANNASFKYYTSPLIVKHPIIDEEYLASLVKEARLLPGLDLVLLERLERPILKTQIQQTYQEIKLLLLELGYEEINGTYEYENNPVLLEHALILLASDEKSNYLSALGHALLRLRQVVHCLLKGDSDSAVELCFLLSGHLNNLLVARTDKQVLMAQRRCDVSSRSNKNRSEFSGWWQKEAQNLAKEHFATNPTDTKTRAAQLIRPELIKKSTSDTFEIPSIKEIAEKIKKNCGNPE